MSKRRFDEAQARKRPAASTAKSSRHAKHSLAAVSALAALAGGATLAAISAVDVTPSAASIPTVSARLDAGLSFLTTKSVKPSGAPVGVATELTFPAASLDGRRLTSTAQPLHSGESAGTTRFMLIAAPTLADEDGYRFLPAEVVEDDPSGFHPVLLASLAPDLDGGRFAEPVSVYASLGQSLSDRMTPGGVDANDIAPVMLASLEPEVEEVERPDTTPSVEEPIAAEAPDVEEPVEAKSPDSGGPVRTRPIRRLGPDGRPMSVASTELAYAPADEPDEDRGSKFDSFKKLFTNPMGLPGPGSGIAVYDIKSAMVYMPNGQKLEAHSGLGKMKDNPSYAHVRMKGPTPPNIYNLRMREALFHGVEAVRMLPTDHAKMRGRDGILAHTYMLRGTNGSNGCLSFKHYDKFLAAFKRGEVEKIIVVPDMTHLPTYMAAL